MSAAPLSLLSSMATQALITDLIAAWQAGQPDQPVRAEAVGGVDAARRVQGGEAVDIVFLAAKAIDTLIAAGRLQGPRIDIVRSGIAVAVRDGAPRPDIGSEDAVRAAVLAAPTLSYSTGPSGVYLEGLFARWGILDEIRPRIVQAPAGVPVGSLVADGRVALGFQQLSELMSLPGIAVLGPLPDAIQSITTFSAAVGADCTRPERARALLASFNAASAVALKQRHGMAPA
ncbi:substrate-binding domain-containing protein [Pseudaquabacterium rugosum]|uniref:Substrate-binding domain-containing protein n=1 Tax=Pseudaquabacterium rugosum TaxID=2984194 RepID=A0ABU9B9K0_9BURK